LQLVAPIQRRDGVLGLLRQLPMVLHQDGIKGHGKRPMSAVRPGPPDSPHEQTAEQDTTRARQPGLRSRACDTRRRCLEDLETMQDVGALAMERAYRFRDRVPAIGQEQPHVCIFLLVLGAMMTVFLGEIENVLTRLTPT